MQSLRRVLHKMNPFEGNSQEWVDAGERAIRQWFDDSDYVRVSNIRGGNAATMIDNCISSFCSSGIFKFNDKIVSILLKYQGWDGLEDRCGLHFGCDWGFTSLHLAQKWNPSRLIAVDVTGKYSYAAREVRAQFDQIEAFDPVELIDAGPWAMAKYRDEAEFLIITKTFGLLDNQVNRKEFYKVLSTLKIGGAVIYFPPSRPGLIQHADYVPLATACGCDDVQFLKGNGRPADVNDPDSVYFIVARKTRNVENKDFDRELEAVGQDAITLASRRKPVAYANENIVERIASVKQEIADGNSELSTLPLRYTLNVISVCNIKCIFCDYPDRLRHWAVPETFLNDIMDTLDGTLRIQITGGEPLLNKTAVQVIGRAKEIPYTQFELISNLTMKPSRELMEKVADGISFITCSIDAATEPTYDQIRQDSNWGHVIGNLRLLREIREEKGNHYPHIQINFIVMGHNVHEIAKFMDVASDLKVDSVAYKWLLWTLTPRITEEARFDFADDEQVRALCEQIVLANQKSRECGIRIVWGPVPHHIQSERPDMVEEYDLNSIFLPADPLPWNDPKRIFSEGPRAGTTSDVSAEQIDQTVSTLDEMPDGLMPCAAPFTTIQINGPADGNFCCYSTPEYRAIQIDSSGSLLDAWNAPKFVEARQHFIDGNYETVCRPHCSLYREYLSRKQRQDVGLEPVKTNTSLENDDWQTIESDDADQTAVIPLSIPDHLKKRPA